MALEWERELLVVAVSYAIVLGLARSLLWSCCDCLNLTKPLRASCSSSSSYFIQGLFYIPFVLLIRLPVCVCCSSWVGDWQLIFIFLRSFGPWWKGDMVL